MAINDTLRKFEEKRFLELTHEDAECIAEAIDKLSGEETDILAKTENTIKDASFTSSHPWFVPYVMATELVDKLPFSPEIAEYLRIHPVVPGNEIFQGEAPDETAQPSVPSIPSPPPTPEVEKSAQISDEISPSASAAPPEKDQRLSRRNVRINTTPDAKSNEEKSSAPSSHDSKTILKFQKICTCFSSVVEFVSKGTLPTSVYFESVVLPYILKKDSEAAALLSARKPSSMDEIMFTLASYDNGVILSSVGFEMISSVLQTARAKFGDRRVQSIMKGSVRTTGDGNLHDAYMRCFPRYPATLQQILSDLKVGIMDCKK